MSSRIPPVVALAMLLAGCGGTQNRGLESVHQPVVSHTDYIFDAAVTPTGLAEGEAKRLAEWMRSLQMGYGDRVAIDDRAGRNPAAASQIASLVEQNGLYLQNTAPVVAVPMAPGTVRIVISRSSASVPGCPDFTRASFANFNNHTTANYGCATNTNLAAMVARADDLVRGQPGADMSDPQISTKAIQTFRRALPSTVGSVRGDSVKGN